MNDTDNQARNSAGKAETWQRVKDIFHEFLDTPENKHEDFLKKACGNNAELRKQVESLLAAHFESESFIENPAFKVSEIFQNKSENPVGKHFGNYKIIREIGIGGMGAVFLATRNDGEFTQEVAIKIIRQTVADSHLIGRFKRERQILASLHHPNIAKLLDGGVSSDGLPFLAMEYIPGEPITKFADRNNLNIEERLKLFLKICLGISYAHRNLIVHRDLKPSNIFVMPDGIPILLDFGLAKLLNDNLNADSNDTITAYRAMTPAYASPEQLRCEKITTASDIYSLGVVLYELLIGERPYRFKNQSLDEAIHVVCETSPMRPSDVINTRKAEGETGRQGEREAGIRCERYTEGNGKTNTGQSLTSLSPLPSISPSELKGDLDNIILMALRKEPERRYPTVEKFAEDIERHLNGLPVLARASTFSYRTEKFIKRNYWGVAAGLIILLSVSIGIVATVWQARRASIQQARAERRFNDVRKLSQSLMFEIHGSVQSLQGSTPIRQLIVSRALEYLNSLAQESSDDPSLQRELATAYEKVGDIQGNPYLSNLGDADGASESYYRASAIREQMAAADSQNIDVKRELASNYDRLGDLLGRTGKIAGAIEVINKSIAIRKKLIDDKPGDSEFRFEMAVSQMKIGEHLHSSGDGKSALEHERQALAIFESLAAQDWQGTKALRATMVTNNKIGYMLYFAGDLKESLEHYRKGFSVAETLAVKNSNNAASMRDMSLCLNNLGRIYLKQKDVDAAREVFSKSIEISQKLAADDPKNAQARSDSAYALVRFGVAQSLAGLYKEAIESERRAITINEALIAENPKNLLPSSEIGDAYSYIGEAYAKMGDLRSALESYQKGAAIREKASAADPSDAQYQQAVAESYQVIGKLYSALAEESAANKNAHLSDARHWYQRSLEIWQELNARKTLSSQDTENINIIQNELSKCDALLPKI